MFRRTAETVAASATSISRSCLDRVAAILMPACALLLLLPVAAYLPSSAAAANGEPISFERVRILAAPRSIQDAELIDQEGKPFQLSQLQGKVSLIFFGFTNCPDICPVTMANWRRFQLSGEAPLDDLNFVLISVDGERDSPEVMKEYLNRFSENFIGLTEQPGKIKPIAKQFKAAFYKDSPSSKNGGYNVTHSPQSYVLDPEGNLRAEFYNPPVDAMAGYMNLLLVEAVEEQVESE